MDVAGTVSEDVAVYQTGRSRESYFFNNYQIVLKSHFGLGSLKLYVTNYCPFLKIKLQLFIFSLVAPSPFLYSDSGPLKTAQ